MIGTTFRTAPRFMSYTIVGVIGHIDHGKTSLVAALTGVDTDTHPEEKRRGITIDLGFASFHHGDHQFALIDAPGHQKYIGNLLAGVSGIDVGLLVVACDQGIQAQTLEHAAILQSLGVEKLIVAISRIDLSDDATLTELREELEVFLSDYGFAEIPIVPLSSVTGAGIDALKDQLCSFARQTDRIAGSEFRLPIDRVFSVEGRGCVVAGTTWSGQVSVGDTVQIAGTDKTARVREIECHGEVIQHSKLGQRTAMNLAGVSANELKRGDELVTPGTHPTASRLLVHLQMFNETQPLRCPATTQFHTGTTSCAARITGVRDLQPGQRAVVVVETVQPIVATFAQQCLFRRPYPVGSFAGGRIVATLPAGQRSKGRMVKLGEKLVNASKLERLVAWVDFLGELPIDTEWMETQLAIPPADRQQIVDQGVAAKHFLISPAGDRLISTAALAVARGYILKLLTQQAEGTDDAWSVDQSVAQRASSTGSEPLVQYAIKQLVDEKQLVRLGRMIAVASDETRLSKKQRSHIEQIAGIYQGSRKPPTTKELANQLGTTIDAVASLVRFMTQQRVLIDLGNGFLIATDVFRQLCAELRNLFDQQPEQSVAAIRDLWQVTRKHAIPLLEYCDQAGVTTRKQDLRMAGPKLDDYLPEQMIEQD
jgi:selenocysteine-specific elongation factor